MAVALPTFKAELPAGVLHIGQLVAEPCQRAQHIALPSQPGLQQLGDDLRVEGREQERGLLLGCCMGNAWLWLLGLASCCSGNKEE